MSEHTIDVTDESYDEDVLQSDLPVLVDFWAAWCGPCKMLSPILDEVAQTYADRLKVVKMDVDVNPETPQKYGVRGIPTLLIIKDGQVVATKMGALSKSQLTSFLEETL